MLYKNIGRGTRTFYGVTFHPGDIKSVPAFINAKHFIRVNSDEVIKKDEAKKEQLIETPKIIKQTKKRSKAEETKEIGKKEELKPTTSIPDTTEKEKLDEGEKSNG